MSHDDFEVEPVPGLPAKLPEGEHIVWQGSPNANAFARSVLHSRKILGYFGIVAIWKFTTALYDGGTIVQALVSASFLALSAVLVAALIWWYARAVKRTTIYTITNKRVVMRFGVALPVTFNYPFAKITTADVKDLFDGNGNIAIGLAEHTRVSWPILWPHTRPWKVAKPEPSMRAIRNVEHVASLLSEQLHAYHNVQSKPAFKSNETPATASADGRQLAGVTAAAEQRA